ncbi:MAG: zinc ribbon domain-containing protein, partial [Planctomycetota bacterium]
MIEPVITAHQDGAEPSANSPPLAVEICHACGAPADSQDRFCPSCGGRLTQEDPDPAEVQELLSCENCGAQVHCAPDSRSTLCPFCASSIVVERHESTRQRPEFVIPFLVTPETARRSFRQ